MKTGSVHGGDGSGDKHDHDQYTLSMPYKDTVTPDSHTHKSDVTVMK